MMNNLKKTLFAGVLLTAFLIAACGDWDFLTSQRPRFDLDLQGTWLSNDPAIYSGTLIISDDRITINGYSEGQTPPRGDDNRRPFKGFTKGTALKGYSEEGQIFIEDGGMVQEGIPYIYWDDKLPPDNRKVKFLRFTFGDRFETLQNSLNDQ
ncbi:MAG: hypothetical protein LBI06_08090 [Treponema sp.]|jgi:hypothetical protein|nr:hypothetical protein [Treponema sp.]